MRAAAFRLVTAATLLALPAAAAAQASPPPTAPAPDTDRLTDAELARITGRFLLPNGIELALSVTSDTAVNGQLVLRTVLVVDQSARLQVFGRDAGAAPLPMAVTAAAGAGAPASALSISIDRQSGTTTITPTFSATAPGTVSVGPVRAADNSGLVALPLVAGAPGIQTPDGVVSLAAVRGGSQVSLAGDRFGIVNLVGQSIATALVNSADSRSLSSVTNVGIDLRGAGPLQAASAALRAETLAIDAVTRGMMR